MHRPPHKGDKNLIRRIKDARGNWREDTEGIQQVLLEYFRGIFTSSRPSSHDLDAVLNTVRSKVTEAMNKSLIVPFTEQEVRIALFINHSVKNRTHGKKGSFALKLDMSKAYDVEWDFLRVEAERKSDIKGIAVSRGAPCVSHLLFADDTIIFSQARVETMSAIKQILVAYGRASRQEINFEKSSTVGMGCDWRRYLE
ncbi:UNVERIFIED_CONTAM: hypothetical protein Slati_2992800 [Sesamum latifolium]|uniref:Reverse transcriptase n=1 Tax=Sesamum latifolium TaxID=2727402 RepID=A0AAW2VGQ7_9LAMI